MKRCKTVCSLSGVESVFTSGCSLTPGSVFTPSPCEFTSLFQNAIYYKLNKILQYH